MDSKSVCFSSPISDNGEMTLLTAGRHEFPLPIRPHRIDLH
jgi:hypothetical protein